jgi:hypothetical protein
MNRRNEQGNLWLPRAARSGAASSFETKFSSYYGNYMNKVSSNLSAWQKSQWVHRLQQYLSQKKDLNFP